MRISLVTATRRAVAGVAIVLAGAILLGAGPPTAWTSPAAVDLGSAAHFAVLAGSGISDTGPSVISGDVGTHPLPAIPDLLEKEASGSVDRAGARSQQAQQDLASAFASVAALPQNGTLSLANDRSLVPGVYAVAEDTQGFASNLTLDGQNAPNSVWIFVVAKNLVTGPGSTITLANGAQACNVFWRVGGSAQLASESTFAGSILAMTSVSVGRSATITGRLLSRTGAVSLGGDGITVPVCSSPSAAKAGALPSAIGVLPQSFRTAAAVAGSPLELPSYLPIVMLVLLVAAAFLGQPRDRHRRRVRRRW
jgi:hypothetical protein